MALNFSKDEHPQNSKNPNTAPPATPVKPKEGRLPIPQKNVLFWCKK